MWEIVAARDNQWDYLERGPARHLHRHRLRAILDAVGKVSCSKISVKILDLGCGDGVITLSIAKLKGVLGQTIIGLDIDMVRLKRAKRKDGNRALDFCRGTALDLPFRIDVFDIVVVHHVIEHIEEDRGVLVECHRVLVSGGLLILGIPNEGGFLGRIVRCCHKKAYYRSDHVKFYSTTSITHLLTGNSFTVVLLRRFGFLIPITIIHYIVLQTKPLFEVGNFLTQFLKFTGDSLLVLAKASKTPSVKTCEASPEGVSQSSRGHQA